MSENKKGKILITGQIELLTGLHIGSGGQGGIGLVDSPVIRNPLNNEPYIPGSSLKGRLRDSYHKLNPYKDTDKKVEHPKVLNLFGMSPSDKNNKNYSSNDEDYKKASTELGTRCTSLVYVRDSHLSEGQSIKNLCEIKYENKIDRLRGIAEGGLRQIERVVAGTKFNFEVVYCIENSFKENLEDLERCFKFLEDEYLGASGSRGYGKVKFHFQKVSFKSLQFYGDFKKLQEKDIEDTHDNEFAVVAVSLIQNQNEKV